MLLPLNMEEGAMNIGGLYELKMSTYRHFNRASRKYSALGTP